MKTKKGLLKELDRVNLGLNLACKAIERFYSQISEKAEDLRGLNVPEDDVRRFICNQQESQHLCQLQDREECYYGLRRNIKRELSLKYNYKTTI